MKKILITIILIISFQPNSFSQGSVITAGEVVNDVVNNLKTQVEDLTFSFEGIVTRQSFDMRQHLLVVSNNLDYILEKNLNKTFDELTIKQQLMLTDIEVLITDLKQPINQTINKLELLTDKANSFAASLPFGKKATLLSNVSPNYILQSNRENVKLIVKGSWLATGKPYIKLKNKKLFPATEIDSKLEFIIPKLDIDTTKVELKTFSLIVYQKRLLGKKKLDYKIGVTTVPNFMANYELEITTYRNDTIRSTYSREKEHRNDHCQGARDVILTVTASTGYKIDKNSIKHSGDVRKNCTYNGLRSVTEAGYQVTAIVRNSGNCKEVLGEVVSYDARGKAIIKTSYTEYKVVENINDKKVQMTGSGFWGQDFIFTLPENTKSFVLTVNKINGEKIIVTDSKNDKWLKIKNDRINKRIIISPEKVNNAF